VRAETHKTLNAMLGEADGMWDRGMALGQIANGMRKQLRHLSGSMDLDPEKISQVKAEAMEFEVKKEALLKGAFTKLDEAKALYMQQEGVTTEGWLELFKTYWERKKSEWA